MWKAFIARYWPPLVSALLLLAAFPPVNLGLLVFVALVPWFMQLRALDGRRAFWSGCNFGLVFMLGQMVWLIPLVGKWTGSWPLAVVPWVLAGLVAQFYFGLAGWLIASCWRQGLSILIPVVWAGVEVLRSVMPGLAFPYGLLATPLAPFPVLIQHAFLGTIILVSAWVAISNAVVAGLMTGDRIPEVRTAILVWLVLLGASLVRYGSDDEGGKKTVVSVGQPGVDLAFTDPTTEDRLLAGIGEVLAQATLQKPKFVLLPEGLVRVGDTLEPDVPFAQPGLPPVVFGGQRGNGPFYQSAFAFDGKWSVADKSRLVVFGEYVPGRDWIPFLDSFRLPSGDLTAAEKVSSVTVSGLTVGPMLCFEGLFWDVADAQVSNGAQMLAILAIDDWYQGTPAPQQLSSMAVWRAVETGLPVLRSATMGHSLIVDARGRVVARAPYGKASCIRAELELLDQPPANEGRIWLPWVFFVSLPVVPFVGRIRERIGTATGRTPPR